MKNKVTDRDRGAKKLLRRLASSGEITVGIHEAEGAEPKEGDDDSEYSLIDVALVHEFGAEEVGIPRRSFIRDWVDENKDEHDKQARAVAKAVIAGDLEVKQGLERLGLRRQGEVQRRIRNRIPPPLEDETVRRKTVNGKKGDVPLVATGQLRGSISHKVTVKK